MDGGKRDELMILVDVNVFMDVLGQRAGAVQSGLVISMVREKKVIGAVSALTIPILWFMESGRNIISQTSAKESTKTMVEGFRMLPLTADVIGQASGSGQHDFEDAIQLSTALASKCEAVITRNKKGFPTTVIKILTPEEFLSGIHRS
jgi:predicted nucleic acid-binding protein